MHSRLTLTAALVVGLGASAAATAQTPAPAAASATASQGLSYPVTRKVEQTDNYHGTTVADPYRWLEDDNSADTKAWVQAENAVTDKFLAAMPQRLPARKLYTDLYNFEKFGVPYKEGGRYFWTRNDGLQQQAVLYTARSLKDTPQVALDPNTLSKDGTVALTGGAVSRDGKLMAYGTAGAGSDWQTWKVRDLDTGKDLPDTIEWVKFSSASWTPDGKGFFYSRYDAPKAGAALTGANYFQKVYYHRLGTAQSADVLVAENPAEKEWGFNVEVTDDGRLALINVWKGSARKNGLMLLPLDGQGGYAGAKPVPLTLSFDAEYSPVVLDGQRLIVKTDKDAPRGRLIAIDLDKDWTAKDPKTWTTLVPETKDALTAASGVGGHLVLSYLQDASTLVRVHAPSGKHVRDLQLPGVGTAAGFGGKWNDPETFFSYTSLTTPGEIWRLDAKTGRAELFKRTQTAFDASQFESKRVFVTSKDGTKLPIFIAHRKGLKLDGSNPTLLYGYGGFNVPMTPGYGVTAATWMKMGGVYVLAVLRGGGEYGAGWHEAGTKLKKQNVFDDFIAAGEYLVANKYTQPAKLAINGGSNGGLLVGAVVNQRPELFGAAVPQVGVMDMLRFHKFTIGWAWTSDYGSSENADEFKALLAYSPLHTIKSGPGVRYPAILVTTGDHDDRVVPAHSFKYTATLQAAETGPAPKLIRIETQAGHGAGKPTSKIIEERADILAFIANTFGMDVK
ncbi:S9 family peptidase [Mitsuaria sp. TWR114]|uniref:prolyl oligopeptidase family serine peptidase n=1 Tax=unclassified Roseateles TaxID=2626991 RepID=UPI0008EB34D0|nr:MULTISPECIES: prolyl oligopeptidase family serine peptidase [unclassified Roseateles]TXD99694.1 S9 family peptidase [Mitsuaria sp. TWR114]SFR72841.1 prolyl oligopeptidase [Mitsuaria sp. PDC51]